MTINVVAADVEDAIRRVREYLDREDKEDGYIKRRVSFVVDSVIQGSTLHVW